MSDIVSQFSNLIHSVFLPSTCKVVKTVWIFNLSSSKRMSSSPAVDCPMFFIVMSYIMFTLSASITILTIWSIYMYIKTTKNVVSSIKMLYISTIIFYISTIFCLVLSPMASACTNLYNIDPTLGRTIITYLYAINWLSALCVLFSRYLIISVWCILSIWIWL